MTAFRRHVACLVLSSLLFVDIAVCQDGAGFDSNKAVDDRKLHSEEKKRTQFYFWKNIVRAGAGDVGDGNRGAVNLVNTTLRPGLGTHDENPQSGIGNVATQGAVNNQGEGPSAVWMNMDKSFNQEAEMNANSSMNNSNPESNMNIHNHGSVNGTGKVDGVPKSKPSKIKISSSVECAEDVQKFCSQGVKDNNFAILDCLQNDKKTNNDVSTACQHFLWKYKRDLVEDDRSDSTFDELCATELSKISECRNLPHGEGLIIPCLIENFENITTLSCRKFLNKMAVIVFSDYRYIYHFAETCAADISKFQCGRLHVEDDDIPHSQGRTVACLAEHLDKLMPQCKKQVLRVYKLQSDDYHKDRPLYYACHDDREWLCTKVKSGNGDVFQCLYDHLGKPDLSNECRVKLELRQRLMNEDVRVEHSFYSKCLRDIEEYQCLRGIAGQEDTKRAHVLLCLENVRMNGYENTDPVCVQEMIKVRQRLLEDININPDLLVLCSDEIDEHCKGLEPGGNTLHCLMGLSRTQARSGGKTLIRDQCRAELQRLLKVINIAEDYRLDKVLQMACGDVVTAVCSHIQPGGGAIINCLMDNLGEDEMNDMCEDRLLEIQFFVARDFRLDPDLFKSCKRDARRYCSESGNWYDPEMIGEPDQGPLVFMCLQRHYDLRSNDDYGLPVGGMGLQLSQTCISAVQRVMRRPAQRLDTMPIIEEACMVELGDMCFEDEEDMERGAELECLQMNYDQLHTECRRAVGRFIEESSKDIQMDIILMKSCTQMIKKFCYELDSDVDSDNLLECLIEHKNHAEMVPKCYAGIEHHQLIALKDFKFNHRFKEACQKSARTLCQHMTTKYEVVSCLSEHVRNDTQPDKKQRVEMVCRKQLKVELMQRGESIKLDPELEDKCSDDVQRLCLNVSPGNAAILECLKKHEDDLTKKCCKLLFKRQEDEFAIADYALVHTCKKMISHYCDPASTEPEIFECLKKAKDNNDFDNKCWRIVIQRQITQSRDYRLNPFLQMTCQQDISMFCSDVIAEADNNAKLEGKVISCLKQQFPIKRLSAGCEHWVSELIKAASIDIRMAPVLLEACRSEITRLCSHDLMHMAGKEGEIKIIDIDAGQGRILECLKTKLSEHKIEDQECRREVTSLLMAGHWDITLDPLLQTACVNDLTLCRREFSEQDGSISCLLSFLDGNPRFLTAHCREMLGKRNEIWKYAAQVAAPESIGENSPFKKYFLGILFTVIAVVILVGISCDLVMKKPKMKKPITSEEERLLGDVGVTV